MKKNRRKKNSYNGWKNWETWNVVLWVMNDYDTYKAMQKFVRDIERMEQRGIYRIEAYHIVQTLFPDGTPDMKDIATEVAYRRVDWQAVADVFNEEMEGGRKKNPLRSGIIPKKKPRGFPWMVWGPLDASGRGTSIGLICLSFPANGDRDELSYDQEEEVARALKKISPEAADPAKNNSIIDNGDHIIIEDQDGKEVCSLDGYPEDDCPLDDPNFSEDYYESGGTPEDREFAKGFEIGKKLYRSTESRQPNGLRRVFDPPPPPPPPRPTYTTPQKMRLRSMGRGVYLPAWNVKVHRQGVFDADAIKKHFKCSQKKAEQAVEWAWEMYRDMWWEDAQNDAEFHLEKLHPGVKVEQDGRSGGWLVLSGLPDVYDRDENLDETFGDETIKALAEFEKDIFGNMNGYLDDRDGLEETIDSNGWCEP